MSELPENGDTVMVFPSSTGKLSLYPPSIQNFAPLLKGRLNSNFLAPNIKKDREGKIILSQQGGNIFPER